MNSSLNKYKHLLKEKHSFNDKHYQIIPVRKNDIQSIRKWRNEQLDVLRQKKPISIKEQSIYYNKIIKRSFKQKNPNIILFSFLLKKTCIGYGGLVHINWKTKQAEVSFISKTSRNKNKKTYHGDFTVFLKLLLYVAFSEFKLNKLTTETFDIRPYVIKILEETGFKFQKRQKKYILIKNKLVDSLIHELNQEDYFKNKSKYKNILVTSISTKVPLVTSIKKSSEKINKTIKIIGADTNEHCIAKFFVDKFWKIPKIEKLSIQKIIKYCKQNKISFIIPTRDGDLLFFSKFKNKLLENGIHVMISDYKTVESCIDKLKFYQYFHSSNFPIVNTNENIDKMNYKLFTVKERYGSSSKNIGLCLRKNDAKLHAKKLEKPIFQPFIKGKEYSVDLYIDKNSKVRGCIIRSRTIIVDGESQVTETVNNKNLEKICKNFVEKFGFYGHIVIQVIISKNKFVIIECNSRFGGASTLSVESGLDSFYWFIKESLGENITKYPFIKSKSNKKQIRYKKDIILK